MNLQYNFTTRKEYQGMNQAILMSEKQSNNYKSSAWITFVQARTLGFKLVNAKGKGIALRTFVTDDTDLDGNEITRPVSFVVFNRDLIKKI